ncbi:hypothetical protein [Muricoccus aerilatus]|uniref:hypothetical protein n=1 Tax=Muricoccus aerilatus TaxID=452982 RepID=UPI0005C1FC80|nr:hypothetical protein [Roseomonas aerilata]
MPAIIGDGFSGLPMVGFDEGGRREEMADLRRKDMFHSPDGLWTIAITDEHRSLKNSKAKRTIPVHPGLVLLGFLEHATRVAPNADDPLSPGREPEGVQRKRVLPMTRWFGRYPQAIGIYLEGVAMHATRHSFEMRLRAQLKNPSDEHRLNYLAGYALAAEERAERYFKGPGAKATARLLVRPCYPHIDLAHL